MNVPSPARRGDIAPFYVMQVMKAAAERAATGAEVLHMEVGQPSTGAPEGVLRAAEVALRSGPLGYTDATGVPELRARIARHYDEQYGLSVDPARVVVATGASGGFVLAFLAAFDVGARVGVLEPGYPCYRNTLEAFGVEAVPVPVGPETRFQPTVEMLDAVAPLDGLVIASPSNPTGSCLTPGELATIAGWCRERGTWLVSDEIYHGLAYGDPARSALSEWDDAIVINSFSKYFSMTGWRLGWLIAPERLVPPIERLAQNLTIAAPTLSQVAAVSAFDCREELDGHVARYAVNRGIVLDGLRAIGLTTLAPADGAFYAYADISPLADDSQALCAGWLAELGVAATPGIDFDPVRGHQFVRFSFAGSTEDMAVAMAALLARYGKP